MGKTIIENFSIKTIREFIINSNNLTEVLKKIGYVNTSSDCRKTFFSYCEENNLLKELDELKERSKIKQKNNLENFSKAASLEQVFCKDSKSCRKLVKKYIIKNKLIPYKCEECGNEGNWNGKELILQLDHINGINNDNRLENLRFLCPNCHSQTETFGSKNLKNKKKKETANELLKVKRWEQIEKSNIDFSKFGWVKQLSKLFNISENKAGEYVKRNFPEFYQSCFIRK